MNVRKQHVGKTLLDRQKYQQYINKTKADPTLVQKLPFKNSNQEGEDLTTSLSDKQRPVSFKTKISSFLHEQWLHWLVAAFVFIAGGILWLTQFNVQKIGFNEETNQKDLIVAKSDIKSLFELNHNHDLILQKQSDKIEQISSDITELKQKFKINIYSVGKSVNPHLSYEHDIL